MRCNASPTTSTVADAAPAPAVAPDPHETAIFTAMLASSIVEPLTRSLGPLDAVFGDALARAAIGRDEPAP